MKMPFLSGTILLVTLLHIFLAVFTLLKGPRKKINLVFFFLCLALAAWTFCHAVAVSVHDDERALFWTRLIMIGPILLPAIFVLFAKTFPDSPYTPRAGLVIFHLGVIAFFLSRLFSPSLIAEAHVVPWGVKWSGGWAFHVYSVYYLVFMGYGLGVVYRNLRKAASVQRMRLLYVLIGSGASIFLGLLASIILPIFGVTGFNKFGPIGTLAMTICCYAMIRHRLLDVYLALRHFFIHGLYAVVFTLPVTAIALATDSMPAVTLAIFGCFFLSPLLMRKWMSRFVVFVDALPMFRGRYESLMSKVETSAREIETSGSISQWARNLADTVNQIFEVESVAVFVSEERQRAYLPQASVGLDPIRLKFISPVADDVLIQEFAKAGQPLQKDYLDYEYPRPRAVAILEMMKMINAQLCVPLLERGRLAGFLSIGRKLKRGKAYFQAENLKLSAFLATLDIPPRMDPNLLYVNKLFKNRMGRKPGVIDHGPEGETLAKTLNQIVDMPGLIQDLPKPEDVPLRSEALDLRERAKNPRGPALLARERAILHTAYLEGIYSQEINHVAKERFFHHEDLKAIQTLVRSAEATLLVILLTEVSKWHTAEWAHDLRHPFSKGSFRLLDTMLGGKLGPLTPEQRRALTAIRQDSHLVERRMAALVGGEAEPASLRSLPLRDLYDFLESRYRHICEASGIQFDNQEPIDGLRATCDPELVTLRVINNLMDNAVRHTPRGGKIEVGFSAKGDEVVCRVTNLGGDPIPEDLRPHLFERGAQGLGGDCGLGGLGLYNASKAIHEMGGTVWVESSKERGTTFFFTLYLAT